MPAPFGPPWDTISLRPANPSAGSPYTLAFAAGFWYHILAVRVDFVTSAAAASRILFLQYFDPSGNGAGEGFSIQTQPASVTYTYRGAINLAPTSLLNATDVLVTVPDIVVPETWSFAINARNIQAADQFSGVTLFYERLAYV